MDKQSLKLYITSLLQRANVNNKHIDLFLSPSNMARFVKAFTHSSFDAVENYEVDEFVGDTIINQFVAFYIRERFPEIKSVKILTRIKHNLVSNKMLAKILYKHGMYMYIRYGREVQESISMQPNFELNKDWMDILADVMEAFCGCLVQVIVGAGFVRGLAIEICNRILKSFFDEIHISTKYEEIFDAVTRLKELYESKRIPGGIRWPFSDTFSQTKPDGGRITMKVYGWPRVRVPTIENRVLLASGTDHNNNKKELKEYLAGKALRILKEKYGISDTVTSGHSMAVPTGTVQVINN